MPDIDAVLSGKDKGPVVTLLKMPMGEVGFRLVVVVVSVFFVSALLSLLVRLDQAAGCGRHDREFRLCWNLIYIAFQMIVLAALVARFRG